MPLHDWTDRGGWEGVHHLWITELLRWVKPRLPSGYRVYIGSAPTVAIGAPAEKPDVSVRQWPEAPAPASTGGAVPPLPIDEPDEEVAVAVLDPETSLFVAAHGRLVAALELVSPRNKDRPVARGVPGALRWLLAGGGASALGGRPSPSVGLLLCRPHCAGTRDPPTAVPAADGGELPRGRAGGDGRTSPGHLAATALRRHPLPSAVLPLTIEAAITVDLEQTYQRAVEDAYLA